MDHDVSMLFTGCAAALVTPFTQEGRVDESALRKLIARQKAAGMDALVLLGTTGEPCTLSMEEREQVIRAGLEETGDAMPVLVGTGANDTKKAMAYAKQAKTLGATGQLCVTPYYNKATQQGLIRHFCAIADSCDLPMLLYNVPARTGVCIQPQTAAALARHPGIAGLKEASGDTALVADILLAAGDTLPVYCGNDDLILSLMSMGAKGAISVCANVVPAQTRAITAACLGGCLHQAAQAQYALLPLIRCLFAQVNPIPVKAALSMMGLIEDILRLPLTPMEEPHRAALTQQLQTLGLI